MAYRRRHTTLTALGSRSLDHNKPSSPLKPETHKALVIIGLLIVFFLVSLSLADSAGSIGIYLSMGLAYAFGASAYVLPFVLTMGVIACFRSDPPYPPFIQLIATPLFYVLAVVSFGLSSHGGTLGNYLAHPLLTYLGGLASYVLLFILALGAFFLSLELELSLILHTLTWTAILVKNIVMTLVRLNKRLFSKRESMDMENPEFASRSILGGNDEEIMEEIEQEEIAEGTGSTKGTILEKVLPKKRVRIKLEVPIDLLSNVRDEPLSGDIKAGQEKIARTLEQFGIDVEMGAVNVGPTVTQYTLKPSEGVKLSRIVALQNDLSLALAAHPIRIEAPIPGKSLVGIEVPNETVATVTLRDLLTHPQFKNRSSNITIPLGKDVAGNPYYADLGRMPHLLIAGATGSGKSVAINSLIISFIYQNTPDTLKFILVDPKRVEMGMYNNIPYLLTPVIHDAKKTISALRWGISEMERRYQLLSHHQKRNFDSYNATAEEKLPYIVFIIDELADLMSIAPQEVESAIIRLAQLSRAVGIHLVLATQRPSVNVITGLIKANIPSRIAFSVASLVDSRTILDASGAEKLLGRGDMLYISAELSKPKRVQGGYLSDNEIEKVTDFLHSVQKAEFSDDLDPLLVEEETHFSYHGGSDNDDSLYEEAKEVVVHAQKASASLLQRRLRVGYARAARLLDLLEEQHIIGPAEGSKPREVLLPKETDEEYISDTIISDIPDAGGETEEDPRG